MFLHLFTGVYMSKMWFRVYRRAAGGAKVCIKVDIENSFSIKGAVYLTFLLHILKRCVVWKHFCFIFSLFFSGYSHCDSQLRTHFNFGPKPPHLVVVNTYRLRNCSARMNGIWMQKYMTMTMMMKRRHMMEEIIFLHITFNIYFLSPVKCGQWLHVYHLHWSTEPATIWGLKLILYIDITMYNIFNFSSVGLM